MSRLDDFFENKGKKSSEKGEPPKKPRGSGGSIRFKCECGEVTDYLDLLDNEGKCPRCGAQLVEFSVVYVEEHGEKRCGDCQDFIRHKGLDVGTCRRTRKIKHENEICDVEEACG